MTALIGFLPGGWEIWVIVMVVLLLFGHRIPAMARSMGSGIVEFKKGLKDGQGGADDAPPPADGQPQVTVETDAKADSAEAPHPQDSGNKNG